MVRPNLSAVGPPERHRGCPARRARLGNPLIAIDSLKHVAVILRDFVPDPSFCCLATYR